MVWFESIGMGSSIIDLLYDEPISLCRRHAGRLPCVGGEGVKGPTGPFQRCRVWMGVVTCTRWFRPLSGPHWGATRWRKRRSEHRPRCWWCSRCSPHAMHLWRRLRDDVLLVVRPSKSGRVFACVMRTVTGTIGLVRDINFIRSPGRAMDARSRAQAKGPVRPFSPALKR